LGDTGSLNVSFIGIKASRRYIFTEEEVSGGGYLPSHEVVK